MTAGTTPVAFLDRDGTLIEERHYLSDPAGVVIERDVIPALHLLRQAGFALVMISNQSGIGRGLMTRDDVDRVNVRLEDLLAEGGISLDGIYICPHAPEDDCDCRKPKTGLIEAARKVLSVDMTRSFVIGDKGADVLCAKACGLTGLLVKTGHGPHYIEMAKENGIATCPSLLDAAKLMLAQLEKVQDEIPPA